MMLGNFSVDKIEDRMGIKFPEDFKKELEKGNQQSADTSTLKPDQWHCFDIPFTLVCGSMDLAQKVFDTLSPQKDDIITALQISIQEAK